MAWWLQPGIVVVAVVFQSWTLCCTVTNPFQWQMTNPFQWQNVYATVQWQIHSSGKTYMQLYSDKSIPVAKRICNCTVTIHSSGKTYMQLYSDNTFQWQNVYATVQWQYIPVAKRICNCTVTTAFHKMRGLRLWPFWTTTTATATTTPYYSATWIVTRCHWRMTPLRF